MAERRPDIRVADPRQALPRRLAGRHRGEALLDVAAVGFQVNLGQRLQQRPLGGGQVASGLQMVGQALGLVERPGLEGGDELALVDDAVLKCEQSEEQMAVGGGGHGESPGLGGVPGDSTTVKSPGRVRDRRNGDILAYTHGPCIPALPAPDPWPALSCNANAGYGCPRTCETASATESPLKFLRLQGTIRADQEDRRNRLDVIGVLHAAVDPIPKETLRPGDSLLRDEVARRLLFGVQAQAEHHKAAVLAEAVMYGFQFGDLSDARSAPSRPEVQQDILAAVVSELHPTTVECLDVERRRRLPDFEHRLWARSQHAKVVRLIGVPALDLGNCELLRRVGDPLG